VVRLSRAELQEHNRVRVLAAAREEFAERGFRDTKVDEIAERAELTRGAVYSNFPSKRALYFAVLAQAAEQAPGAGYPPVPGTADAILGNFARAWIAPLPLADEDRNGMAWLGRDLLPEIAADEHTSRPFSQLTSLSAILLGLCLEQSRPPGHAGHRMVKVAEIALTALHGASQLAASAPGFADPFAVVQACEQLTALGLGDAWQPTHLPHISAARPASRPWAPPPATDALRGQPARLDRDGILAVLGLHRLAAIEEALRAAPPADALTAALVTSDPGELGPLARLSVTGLRNCLRAAVAPTAWPRLQLIHDEHGVLASEAGVSAISDATESAVRISNGRIVAQADGYGACHAASTA
jgi:AcrR family transcriptional regulator